MYTTCHNRIKYMRKLTHMFSHKNAYCLWLWAVPAPMAVGVQEGESGGEGGESWRGLVLRLVHATASLLSPATALCVALTDETLVPQSLSALLKLPAVAEGELGNADAEGSTWS